MGSLGGRRCRQPLVQKSAAQAAAAAADAVVIMAGTIAEEGADRVSFADASGLAVTAIGDGLDWDVARSNLISTPTSNPPANSNTVAMIAGILGASSTSGKPMVAKTALVLKDNAGQVWVGSSSRNIALSDSLTVRTPPGRNR